MLLNIAVLQYNHFEFHSYFVQGLFVEFLDQRISVFKDKQT